MLEPIEKLPFDPFDKLHSAQWSSTVTKFDVDKTNIELSTRAFIDTSFKKLRSAEGG